MSKRVTQSDAPEFRAEAIKLVLEQGLSAFEAAARLNMNHVTPSSPSVSQTLLRHVLLPRPGGPVRTIGRLGTDLISSMLRACSSGINAATLQCYGR